jgi:hypothetical protein
MSLAAVQLTTNDFQSLYQHLTTYKPHCRNMHLRDHQMRNGRRTLRHLHAMYATSTTEIVGMISGPSVFCDYRIELGPGMTRLLVRTEEGSPQEIDRLRSLFLQTVLGRMHEEQSRTKEPMPRYLPGELYLRRRAGGMAPSHQHARLAVSSGALDQRFVSQLQPWNLTLRYQ